MPRKRSRPKNREDDDEDEYFESALSSSIVPPKRLRSQHSERTTSRAPPTKRTRTSTRLPSCAVQSDIPPSSKGQGKDKKPTANLKSFVKRQTLSDDGAPPQLKALARELHICASGLHTIPMSHKDTLAASARNESQLVATYLQFMFVDDTVRAALGTCPTVHEVEKVTCRSEDAEREDHCKESWNTFIHARTFDLAFENSRFQSKLDYLYCDSAEIEPQDLLSIDDGGAPMRSRTVDFAIVLRENERIDASYRKLIAGDPELEGSWNQTFQSPLHKKPIVVSITTTNSGTEKEDAIEQLSTWVTAQYRKLEQLVPSEQARAELPFLPLILIQGSDWRFLAATRKNNMTHIWEGVHLGNTTTPRQLYPLIACLQHLGKWALEVYKPWFETNVVDVLLQQ